MPEISMIIASIKNLRILFGFIVAYFYIVKVVKLRIISE